MNNYFSKLSPNSDALYESIVVGSYNDGEDSDISHFAIEEKINNIKEIALQIHKIDQYNNYKLLKIISNKSFLSKAYELPSAQHLPSGGLSFTLSDFYNPNSEWLLDINTFINELEIIKENSPKKLISIQNKITKLYNKILTTDEKPKLAAIFCHEPIDLSPLLMLASKQEELNKDALKEIDNMGLNLFNLVRSNHSEFHHFIGLIIDLIDRFIEKAPHLNDPKFYSIIILVAYCIVFKFTEDVEHVEKIMVKKNKFFEEQRFHYSHLLKIFPEITITPQQFGKAVFAFLEMIDWKILPRVTQDTLDLPQEKINARVLDRLRHKPMKKQERNRLIATLKENPLSKILYNSLIQTQKEKSLQEESLTQKERDLFVLFHLERGILAEEQFELIRKKGENSKTHPIFNCVHKDPFLLFTHGLECKTEYDYFTAEIFFDLALKEYAAKAPVDVLIQISLFKIDIDKPEEANILCDQVLDNPNYALSIPNLTNLAHIKSILGYVEQAQGLYYKVFLASEPGTIPSDVIKNASEVEEKLNN